MKIDAAAILVILRGIGGAEECGSPSKKVTYVLTDRTATDCGELEALRVQWKYLRDHEKRQALISRFVAEDVLKTRPAGTGGAAAAEQLELGFFFGFDVDHCGLEPCYPVVRAPTTVPANGWCPDSEGETSDQDRAEREKTDAGRVETLARCLREALSSARVATYSVTPGKEVQRLQLLDKQALVMAAEDREGSLLSWSGHEIAETAGFERDPVILGIGDWGSRTDGASSETQSGHRGPPTASSQTPRGAEGRRGSPPETKFAWVVLPRGQVSGAHRAEQRPDHVTMSAVVSVPSWWKSVDLTVASCWLDSTSLVFDPDKLCKDVGHEFEIALPGNASEVMTKLRFEVLTFPYLFGSQRQHENVLEVGRKGSLIIIGGRLWRSPKVIMGNQIADRIEVLPDMDGIVAHFNCVHPYPGTPGAPRDDANLSQPPEAGGGDPTSIKPPAFDGGSPGARDGSAAVWTSEGRTGYLQVEFRPYQKRAGERTEDPCWLHEDEDKPSVESSGSSSAGGRSSRSHAGRAPAGWLD